VRSVLAVRRGDVFLLRNTSRNAMKVVVIVPTEDLVLTNQINQRDTLQESTPSCVRYGPIKELMCRHTENCVSRCMSSSLFLRLLAFQIALKTEDGGRMLLRNVSNHLSTGP